MDRADRGMIVASDFPQFPCPGANKS